MKECIVRLGITDGDGRKLCDAILNFIWPDFYIPLRKSKSEALRKSKSETLRK
jgi:hypothetical protein